MKVDSTVVACITGGADGIGFELAKLFLEKGASVALVDIRGDVLRTALEKLTGYTGVISTHVLDVRDRVEVSKVVSSVSNAHGGRVSVLINSAGVFGGSSIDKISYQDFDRVMDINLTGTFNVCKEFFPVLRKESEAYILNLSSLDGLVAMPGALSYVTSKFAVTGFSRALGMDLKLIAPQIHVASVHPGFVSTNIVQNNQEFVDPLALMGGEASPHKEKLKTLVTPETVHQFQLKASSTTPRQAAEQILQGMYWNRTRIVVGNDAVLLDVFSRLFPSAFHHHFVFGPLMLLVVALTRFVGKIQIAIVLSLWIWRRYYR